MIGRRTRLAGLALLAAGALVAWASKGQADPRTLRLAAILLIAAGGGLMIFGAMRRTLDIRMKDLPRDD